VRHVGTVFVETTLIERQQQGHNRIPGCLERTQNSRCVSRGSKHSCHIRRCNKKKVRGAAGEEVDECSPVTEEGNLTPRCMRSVTAHARRSWNSNSAIRAFRVSSTRRLPHLSSARTRIPPAGCHEPRHDTHSSPTALPSPASHFTQFSPRLRPARKTPRSRYGTGSWASWNALSRATPKACLTSTLVAHGAAHC
jgi:hypothetical protein